jgi:hypothetical protein
MNLIFSPSPSALRGFAVALPSVLCLLVAAPLARAASPEQAVSGPLQVVNQLSLNPRQQNRTWTGSVTSQTDAVLSGPQARSTFGVDGSGIKIGIISDSFNYFDGLSSGVLTGDLPGLGNPNGYLTPVSVLSDDLFPGNLDEGRALAEVIHDIAPGAELMFHSAFNSSQTSPGGSIATAIDNLVAAGANVIIDDVFSLGAPMFQDGAAARAVNNAYAHGVAYFSSAGNNSNNAYEAMYSGLDNNHDFDANLDEGGDIVLDIGSISSGSSFVAGLWWEDAYASLGGTPTTDFQLGLYNITDGVVEGGSGQNQLTGADPFEAFGFTNTSGTAKSYGLFVEFAGGDPNKLFKIQVFDRNIDDDDDTNSPTIGGHNSAVGALAVGAAPFFDPDHPEMFTSQGPTMILFDEVGNPLAVPEIRNTPALTGLDGGNTSFFYTDSGIDPDVFPNFFGTSAAVPHVAAIAALVLEKTASLGFTLSPQQLYELLMNSTVDIGEPGYDHLTGYGRLDAYLAVEAASLHAPEPATATMILFACAASLGIRTRRGQSR